jgi:cupin 2 domain-containing protein
MNNIFAAIPRDLDNELVEQLAQSQHARIERIVSKGHRSPASGWYDQAQNEWVMLLKGKAVLVFSDDTELTLRPGDYIDIPAHKKHRVQWTDPDTDSVWLAVHY